MPLPKQQGLFLDVQITKNPHKGGLVTAHKAAQGLNVLPMVFCGITVTFAEYHKYSWEVQKKFQANDSAKLLILLCPHGHAALT